MSDQKRTDESTGPATELEPPRTAITSAPPPRPNPLIYGHFDRLVPITVMGRTFDVPEGIPLIRAFQFIQFELDGMTSDWSLFCFNDTIGCCAFEFCNADGAAEKARACCLRVDEGLEVVALPEGSAMTESEST